MSVENWLYFLETDEQHKQTKLLRHALSRVTKKPIQRRITSSAHSDRIYAVDCCWLAKDNLLFENLLLEASNTDAMTVKSLIDEGEALKGHKSDENVTCSDSALEISSLTEKSKTTTTNTRSLANVSSLQSHILFGLSNGSVCVMNTSALTKVYLFYTSTERKRFTSSTETNKEIPVVLDVAVLPASAIFTNAKTTNKTYCAMCIARNKTIQISIFDTEAFTELKKLRDVSASTITYYPIIKVNSTNDNNNISNNNNSNGTNLLSLSSIAATSSTANAAVYGVPVIRFSPTGEHVVVVLPCVHALGISHQMLILQKKKVNELASSLSSSSSVYDVANTWRTISLASSSQLPVTWHDAMLLYCEWWNTELLLLIFSDGLMALLEPFTNAIIAKTYVTDKMGKTLSCCTECVTSAVYTRCSGNSKWCEPHEITENKSVHGILAVTYSFNVVATFTMNVYGSSIAKSESRYNGKQHLSSSSIHIELIPTLQTYCAEDNSVRQMRLTNVFDWVLCILLESGAVLFFNAFTMEQLVHCAIQRTGFSRTARNDKLWLEAVKARYKNATNIAQLISPRLHRLCLLHNPVSICVIDGNNASIFKS